MYIRAYGQREMRIYTRPCAEGERERERGRQRVGYVWLGRGLNNAYSNSQLAVCAVLHAEHYVCLSPSLPLSLPLPALNVSFV